MKSIKLMAILFVLLSCNTLSQAQDQKEESGAYAALSATVHNTNIFGVEAKLGYNFNKFFSVETQAGLGLTKDSNPVANFANAAILTDKMEYSVGAFAVGRIPLSEQFEVFARAGIHSTQYNVTITNALGTNFDVQNTGFAGGGGVQYNLDKRNAIRAEYTYLDGSEISTASLGYVRKF